VADAERKLEHAKIPATVKSGPVDYAAVREAIIALFDDSNYDDGSYGPLFVRLAWHASGTYDNVTNTGGSEGASMRFPGESNWGANAGLHLARNRLEPIKARFPGLTYADLWTLAGSVAIEEMGGPKIDWRSGRKDALEGPSPLPDGRLPDADGRDKKDHIADHLRDIFYKMGFDDREIVALSGGHALGRCHTDRSGFWGPWTRAPTTFSNEFYVVLLNEEWKEKKTHQGKTWNGPRQFEDKSGELMMLPSDVALIQDPKMKVWVEKYAADEKLFFDDFSKAWIKLIENGVKRFHGTRRYYFFGPRE